jgi:DNA invertase Pin-like site-specific DNA recombinase
VANPRKKTTPAIAYLRTSSAANVGVDKDSERRQREAIKSFAKHRDFEIVAEFYDAAVSGKDPIEGRPGFKALLERIVTNGVKVVIVEDASRFARHLMTQEAGIALLVQLGVRVMTATGDDLTDSDDEFRVAMRQIMGVFSQLERTRLVKKLKAAKDRKRAAGGKAEGRKSHAQIDPHLVALVKRLHRASPKTGERRSLRQIAKELAEGKHSDEHGKPTAYLNQRGQPFNAKSIKAMLEQSVRQADA